MIKSIQTKLTITVLTIFLVALSVLGGINYWKARGIITESITKEITNQTDTSASGIGDWLEARKTELTVMALTPAIKSGNRELIVPLIDNVAKGKSIYSIIGYIYPDGAVVNTLGTSVNLKEREYFKKAMKGENFIADPFPSKTSGHLNIVVAVPVKENGMVTGVLYGAIDVEGLTERVLDIQVGQTGYGYVVQGDGSDALIALVRLFGEGEEAVKPIFYSTDFEGHGGLIKQGVSNTKPGTGGCTVCVP